MKSSSFQLSVLLMDEYSIVMDEECSSLTKVGRCK
jgi:hypothetical protein